MAQLIKSLPVGHNLLTVLKNTGAAFARGFWAMTEAAARTREIEALQRLSDEELKARYGITRNEITRYVFRDSMI